MTVTDQDIQSEPVPPTLDEVAAVIGAQRSRTRKAAAVTGIVGLAVGVGSVLGYGALTSRGSNTTPTASVTLTTVAAEKRDVTIYTAFAGTLGYGSAVNLVTRGSGVVTGVPASGTDLVRGDVAFHVAEQPVALLYGDLPVWRSLSTASTAGPDVKQLETNLAALGYTDGGNMTVDDTFTAATAAALKAFETHIGISAPDGVLDPGEVVYAPGKVRVDTSASVGTTVSPGAQVLSVAVIEDVTDKVTGDHTVTSTSTPTQSVTLTVATTDQGNFKVGAPVVVELADGRLADGAISTIGSTARRSGNGPNAQLVVDVTVAITSVPTGGLIEGPANVRVTTEQHNGITMVPVRALVALAEGGYAVQVASAPAPGAAASTISISPAPGTTAAPAPTSGGATATSPGAASSAPTSTYVAVTTGVYQDGWVEVTGNIKPGDLVEVTQ